MVFDKTGTLTTGNFGVTRIESHQSDWKEEDIIRFAAALETHSEHPIATGIINKVKAMDITAPSASGFQSITGAGVTATVEGKSVAVVSPGYLREHQLKVPKGGNDMETIVYLIVEDQLVGEIALSDEIRADAASTVSTLKKLGIKVIMATGDNERVAKAVAEKLGLDDFHAAVLPHEKVDIVKKLQAQKEFVCMTGDGVNDAPALAQADIGLAVGSGTDVAAETADIILVQSDPSDILNLVRFGRATYAKMMQNLVWATAYNVLAIPLAAGVLAGVGFVLEPAVGAVFMSLSTIVVAVNAQLLRLDFKTAKAG
jgi:Cu2+-exporting ATPase